MKTNQNLETFVFDDDKFEYVDAIRDVVLSHPTLKQYRRTDISTNEYLDIATLMAMRIFELDREIYLKYSIDHLKEFVKGLITEFCSEMTTE